jgi:hypothetical protein
MRRVFLSRGEVPDLLRGVLIGDATSLRRILGARRGGRYGAVLAAIAALAAIPLPTFPGVLLAHVVLSVAGRFAAGPGCGLGPRQYQRLVMWAIALPLLAAAPLRLLEPGALVPIAALAVGHGLLWSGLRRGLAH